MMHRPGTGKVWRLSDYQYNGEINNIIHLFILSLICFNKKMISYTNELKYRTVLMSVTKGTWLQGCMSSHYYNMNQVTYIGRLQGRFS